MEFPGRTYLVLKMILYLTSEFLELESGYKMLMFIFFSLYSKVVVVSGIMGLRLLAAQQPW